MFKQVFFKKIQLFYRKPFFFRKFIVFLCNCFCFFSNKLGKFSQFFTCGVFHYFPAFSYRFLSFLWVNGFWPMIHYVLPSLLPQFMRYLSGFFFSLRFKRMKVFLLTHFSFWPNHHKLFDFMDLFSELQRLSPAFIRKTRQFLFTLSEFFRFALMVSQFPPGHFISPLQFSTK